MKFRSITLALVLMAFGAGTEAAQPTKVQEVLGGFTGMGATTQTATGAAIGTGHAVVGTLFYSNPGGATLTNVQVGGTNATIIGTVNGSTGSQLVLKNFWLGNVTGNPTTVTANFSVAANYIQIIWQEVYPIASLDTHSEREVLNASTAVNGITTASATTAQADYVYGVLGLSSGNVLPNQPQPGTGFTRGVGGDTAVSWGLTENLMQTAGGAQQVAFTYSSASDNWLVGMAAFKLASYPVSASCPVSGSFVDTTAAHTVICGYTVTTSDGVAYAGVTTATPALFEVAAPNLRFASVPGTQNDGTVHANLNFAQNGVSINLDVPVTITGATVTGTPLAIGWKGVDPTGQVVFTAPHTYVGSGVNQLLLRNSTLLGSTGILHVYKVAPNVACTLANVANMTSLHNGDFDLNNFLNQNQMIAPITANQALAIGDSVCVLTRNGANQPLSSPGSMQGTLSVTVN